ncbi:MAG: AI-2E family transporter [bacterium]|nr:AI-2E family transporter [bacterium]
MTALPPTPSTESAIYQPEWAGWVRQFTAIAIVIMGVWALTLLSPVVNILITTFLLSFIMFVPARLLAWRTVLTYPLCVVIMFGVVLGILTFALVLVVPAFFELIQNIIVRIFDFLDQVQQALITWTPETQPQLFVTLPLGFTVDATPYALPLRDAILGVEPQAALQQLQAAILSALPFNLGAVASSVASTIGTLALGFVGGFGNFLSTLVVSLLLSLIILLELPRYQKGALEAYPEHQRELRLLGQKIMRVWQGFFRGQLFLCFVIGVLTYIQLLIMGIPSAFIVAVIVALISLIPTIGGILALIPLSIVPLIQGSTTLPFERLTVALAVVIVNLVISQVIWNVIAPKVMGDAVNLPLPLIILGIIVGSALGGVFGAFLIVPLLGMIRVILLYLLAKVTRHDPFPGEEMPDVIELAEI